MVIETDWGGTDWRCTRRVMVSGAPPLPALLDSRRRMMTPYMVEIHWTAYAVDGTAWRLATVEIRGNLDGWSTTFNRYARVDSEDLPTWAVPLIERSQPAPVDDQPGALPAAEHV